MGDPERLARRVATLAGCSRSEAEQYIEGGWVFVDGHVVDRPQRMVSAERIEIDPAARLQAAEPATLLLHKAAGVDAADPAIVEGLSAATRWADDGSGIRVLKRHFVRATQVLPLEPAASGLVVLTQDGRVWRRLTEDADAIEQEFVVEVAGSIVDDGLSRLCHGMRYRGRPLPPCKASWQSECRLRFAIKAVQAGQLQHMCREVGLDVLALRRLRVGKVSLSKMPIGAWRYMPTRERF